MTPEEMPILEATAPVRFRNRAKLMKHVVKHLIEGRDERWQHLVDESTLAAARVEHREGRRGAASIALARQYQSLVGNCLVELCQKGRSHRHICRLRWNLPNLSPQAVSQIIEGWPEQEKLFLVASAPVKRGKLAPYYLTTAFRPWPRLSASAYRRKVREWLRNKKTLYPRMELAVHDA